MLSNIIDKIYHYFTGRPKQRTFVYCPYCRNEMVGDIYTDVWEHEITGIVKYRCGGCRKITYWDFDAPAPLLLSKDEC